MRNVLANGFFTKGLIMQKKDVWGFLVILGLLVSVSSAGLMGQGAMKQKSLYDRLGGKDAITAVVDAFVAHGGRQSDQWLLRDNGV
jgi:hypothetical protein